MLTRILMYVLFVWGVSIPVKATSFQTEPFTISRDEVVDLSGFTAWCSAEPERTVEEITNGGCAFNPTIDKNNLRRGLSAKAFWLKFELYSPYPNVILRWLQVGHPRLQSVIVYQFSQDGVWRETKTGLDVPSAIRPIVTELPILPIEIQPYERNLFLVRIASETLIDLSTTLITPRAYFLSTSLSRMVNYMSLGAALLACVFCLIIFVRLKEKSLFLLAGTLVFAAAFDAGYTGVTATIIWPDDAPFPLGMQASFTCLSLICFSAFILSYIPADARLRRIKLAIILMLCSSIVLAVYSLAVSYRHVIPYIIALAFVIIASLMILIIAVRRIGAYPPSSILWSLVPILLIIVSRWMVIAGLLQQQFIQSIGFSWALTILSPVIIGGIVKRAEEQRRKLAKIAIDSSVRTEFVTYMSHEFRSPLNLIISYADLVARGSPRVTITEAITAIKHSGHELLTLVDGVLDYMRRESSEVRLDVVVTKLAPFLEGVASEANQLAISKGNQFDISISGVMPDAVEVDQLRLKQVLRNLISNANRYTNQGVVVLKCHSEQTSGGRCRLDFAVVDTGIGIEQQDLSSIFEPFVRGSAAQSSGQKGFGIGLSLSKSIVEMMGSKLTVISYPGRGSKFSFSIECAIVAVSENHRMEYLEDSRPRRALLVDDDPQALMLLTKLLADCDVELVTARSGDDALKKIDKAIDLVITDQCMEDGDGWKVLKAAAPYRIPVILISTEEPRRPLSINEEVKFAAVFRKPVEIERLYTKINEIMGISFDESRPIEVSEDVMRFPDSLSGALDVGQLLILRQLVREGAVSKIEEWIADGESMFPEHSGFYEAVRVACSGLDFRQLAKLAEDREQ